MATWTQTDIDNLKASIAQGVLSVRYDGPPAREVQYRSIEEMFSVLSVAQQSVNRAAGIGSYALAGSRKGT